MGQPGSEPQEWEAKAKRCVILVLLIPIPVTIALLVWSESLSGHAQTFVKWSGLVCMAVGSMVISNVVFRVTRPR